MNEMQILEEIDALLKEVAKLSPSREISLVATKLDEAVLWLERHVQVSGKS